jgi:CheY-like chemotaxis protein
MESEMAAAGVLENLARPHTLSKLKSRLKETISQIRSDVEEQEGEDENLLEIRKRILRILLAEDNLINQKVAKVVLEKVGHHVDIADDGQIAVQMFREGQYDLILMDIHMPEMDGREATRKIRELEAADPARFPVQICALTANFTDEDEELCYQAGMNSYISKPFKLEELTRVLNRV